MICFSGRSVAKNLFDAPPVSTESLVKVQLNTGLSNFGMRKLVSTINQVADTKIVEPNFCSKFLSAGQQLASQFTMTTIKSDSQNTSHVVVHCKNLEDLIDEILTARKVYSRHSIKISMDGGRGFLKISLAIMDFKADDDPRSPPRKKLLTNQTGKSTNVKSQFLVAVSEGLSENHANIQKVWSLAQIEKVEHTIACDMKVANILVGLQSHSCTHPCPWCDVDAKELHLCGTLRTLGNVKAKYQTFLRSGGDSKMAKFFGNVVHEPIISGSDDKLILDLIPPMELHLLLGIVNHLFKALIHLWPMADQWPTSLHLSPEPYHGGQFTGNACHKLLKNVDLLQRMAEQQCAFQTFGVIDILRKFGAVVSSCFGSTLGDSYSARIDEFKEAYLAQPHISITPKAHAVFYHVKQFVQHKKSSLGQFSEQQIEALHHDFSNQWQRFKRNQSHPDYGKQLLQCIVDFNSKRI